MCTQIVGVRHWNDFDLAERRLDRKIWRNGPIVVILRGKATGVDAAFEDAV